MCGGVLVILDDFFMSVGGYHAAKCGNLHKKLLLLFSNNLLVNLNIKFVFFDSATIFIRSLETNPLVNCSINFPGLDLYTSAGT